MKDVIFVVGLGMMGVGGCLLSVPWTLVGMGALFVVFAIVMHLFAPRTPPRGQQ